MEKTIRKREKRSKMIIYCQTKEEVLNRISSWIADLKGKKQIEIKIQKDETINKTYIVNISEKRKGELNG